MCIGQEYNEGTLLQDTRIINYPGAFINTLMRVRERARERERLYRANYTSEERAGGTLLPVNG